MEPGAGAIFGNESLNQPTMLSPRLTLSSIPETSTKEASDVVIL
jgi:hypothetical protein